MSIWNYRDVKFTPSFWRICHVYSPSGNIVRLWVLQVTTMNIVFLWVVTQCNLVNECCRFTRVYYCNPNIWRFCSSILKMKTSGSYRALLLIYQMLCFHISEESVLNLRYSESSLIIIFSILPSISVVWLICLRIVSIGLCFYFRENCESLLKSVWYCLCITFIKTWS